MRGDKFYVLIDRRVVATTDMMQWARWARWMELSRRDNSSRVAETTIGDFWISTVFLGLDHRFSGNGPPIVFETMVFSHKGDCASDENMARYCTFEEAQRGHDAVVSSLQVLHDNSIAITRAMLDIVRAGVRSSKDANSDE